MTWDDGQLDWIPTGSLQEVGRLRTERLCGYSSLLLTDWPSPYTQCADECSIALILCFEKKGFNSWQWTWLFFFLVSIFSCVRHYTLSMQECSASLMHQNLHTWPSCASKMAIVLCTSSSSSLLLIHYLRLIGSLNIHSLLQATNQHFCQNQPPSERVEAEFWNVKPLPWNLLFMYRFQQSVDRTAASFCRIAAMLSEQPFVPLLRCDAHKYSFSPSVERIWQRTLLRLSQFI